MPELPDIALYLHALEGRVLGQVLDGIRIRSPSLLKSFDPPVAEAHGRKVVSLDRLGKRVVFGLEGDLYLIIHLMISGRFQWKAPGADIPRKLGQAAFDFAPGTLLLTEASTHKRASLHLVRGREVLASHDPGGIEPLDATLDEFMEVLRSENRTLKRALTDPRLLSGIGNAYSDEILLLSGLSPVKRSRQLSDEEIGRLYESTQRCLREWTTRLIEEADGQFPKKVTAFHPEMAAHGKYGDPCPHCGTPIQRIVYAKRETNYCPTCQTGGKLLADRALSRLLREDWPRSVEELENLKRPREGS